MRRAAKFVVFPSLLFTSMLLAGCVTVKPKVQLSSLRSEAAISSTVAASNGSEALPTQKTLAASDSGQRSTAALIPASMPARTLVDPATTGSPRSTSLKARSSSSPGKEIVCTPSIVRPGDTLTIETRSGLPELGVKVPDRKVQYLFLINDYDPNAVLHSDTFLKERRVNLIVSSASLKNGLKIFSTPGQYIFQASTNLETDDPSTPKYRCLVTLKAH